jgi:hypothetical protein
MPQRLPKRSPLKSKPLRVAGQSLSDQLDRLITERVLFWGMLASLFAITAGLEWYRTATQQPPHPWLMTLIAAAVVGVAIWRVRSLIPTVRQMKRGLEGERAVGQLLEELRAHGFEVLHDIPGDGHNVDHVLVGPTGVFVIETKTISKPKGDRRVVFDGKAVRVDGAAPDRDPIAQVKAAAREVKQIIHDRAGFETEVQPVVLYPGWFTDRGFGKDVWVLNETALRTTLTKPIDDKSAELPPERVRQISTAIARHVWDASRSGN